MKLSVAWIFDHIDADYHKIDIVTLIELFNQKVAEIEGFYTVATKLDSARMVQVKKMSTDGISAYSPECRTDVVLPARDGIVVDKWYIVQKVKNDYQWATAALFGGDSDLLPAVCMNESQAAGGWKKTIEATDYILEVDNKSLTHRPDMWGYRGIAREIALLLKVPLKPYDSMLVPLPIKTFDTASVATDEQPFGIKVHHPEAVKRFAVAYFAQIPYRPSLPWMCARLCRVEQRPIDAIVDMTNYVMLDVGQPVHAFDADRIATKRIEPRLAQRKEKLTLLDGDELELSLEDVVITDGVQPIALGGVMGGAATAVTSATQSILLESANFDATTIRNTATRHKKRTEASARFEKSLDPNQNVTAIERFVKLLEDAQMPFEVSSVYSGGPQLEPQVITVSHTYIQDRLGITITHTQIRDMLDKLGCSVAESTEDGQLYYHITVPSWRSSKDLRLKQDIVEEIGRLYGYMSIPFVLPKKQTSPTDLHPVYAVRQIKRQLAFVSDMHEVRNYAFYDEHFLRELAWQPDNAVRVKNPVSEHWQRMVTSLVPHLLKDVTLQHETHDTLRFFEMARIWHQDGKQVKEAQQLAGVMYSKKELSFYAMKAEVQKLCAMLRLPISWKKADGPLDPWFAPFKTAYLYYEDQLIGTAGMARQAMTHKIFEGHAFLFSFDAAFLAAYAPPIARYKPASKYPSIDRDISMIVPLSVTVAEVTQLIAESSSLITAVSLVDFFQKKEWVDTKALTFRFVLQDVTKTLTKSEADSIWERVAQAMHSLGAQIR